MLKFVTDYNMKICQIYALDRPIACIRYNYTTQDVLFHGTSVLTQDDIKSIYDKMEHIRVCLQGEG